MPGDTGVKGGIAVSLLPKRTADCSFVMEGLQEHLHLSQDSPDFGAIENIRNNEPKQIDIPKHGGWWGLRYPVSTRN